MRIHLVASHLLILAYIAQSFVLLTANVDDIKKLARKFVSDSLADKIAEFVVKVTEQMVTNVSEENDINAVDVQDISNENNNYKLRNIARQRGEITVRPKKDTFNNAQKNTPSVKNDDRTVKASNRWIKERNEVSEEVYSKIYHKPEKTPQYPQDAQKPERTPLHNLDRQRTDRTPQNNVDKQKTERATFYNLDKQRTDGTPQYNLGRQWTEKSSQYYLDDRKTERIPQYNTDNPKPKTYKQQHQPFVVEIQDRKPKSNSIKAFFLTTDIPVVDSTQLRWDEIGVDEKRSLRQNKKNKKSPAFKLTAASEELNDTKSETDDEAVSASDSEISTMREFNIGQIELTTEKEKTEFDQYDNRNYPKADFIATSGPVSLPKVSAQEPWWEKEIPAKKTKDTKEIEDAEKQAWFI